MLARMHEVQAKVDDLVFETSVAESNLQNAFNEFIMLSNTQFIENVRHSNVKILIFVAYRGR
jgi:hypothetical protein